MVATALQFLEVLAKLNFCQFQKKLVYFTAVNNARFKKAVIPGDQLVLVVKLLKFKLGTCKISGEAYVNDELVANSELMATVVDRKK